MAPPRAASRTYKSQSNSAVRVASYPPTATQVGGWAGRGTGVAAGGRPADGAAPRRGRPPAGPSAAPHPAPAAPPRALTATTAGPPVGARASGAPYGRSAFLGPGSWG